jgi:hypothetical protein
VLELRVTGALPQGTEISYSLGHDREVVDFTPRLGVGVRVKVRVSVTVGLGLVVGLGGALPLVTEISYSLGHDREVRVRVMVRWCPG